MSNKTVGSDGGASGTGPRNTPGPLDSLVQGDNGELELQDLADIQEIIAMLRGGTQPELKLRPKKSSLIMPLPPAKEPKNQPPKPRLSPLQELIRTLLAHITRKLQDELGVRTPTIKLILNNWTRFLQTNQNLIRNPKQALQAFKPLIQIAKSNAPGILVPVLQQILQQQYGLNQAQATRAANQIAKNINSGKIITLESLIKLIKLIKQQNVKQQNVKQQNVKQQNVKQQNVKQQNVKQQNVASGTNDNQAKEKRRFSSPFSTRPAPPGALP